MRGDEAVRAEFDAAYPHLVAVVFDATQNFFRYDGSIISTAVAETLAEAYGQWEKIGRPENAQARVIARAKDVCLEILRAKCESPEDPAEIRELSATIWMTLDNLSKKQRDVAVLRFLMDCDEPTTASALRTSEWKVHELANKARDRMHGVLDDLYPPADEDSA